MRASELGGRTRRRHPDAGMRPTVLFTLACLLTALWIAFSVWASGPWRDDLDAALGPVMAWVIPILMAYIPGLVIGFMCFTLILSRYRGRRPQARRPARGHRARGHRSPSSSPPGTSRRRSRRPSRRSPPPSTRAGSSVVLADNNSSDETARRRRRHRRTAGARLPPRVRARAGQVPRAQHGALDGHDAAGDHRRRRHRACTPRRSTSWSPGSRVAPRTSTSAPAPARWSPERRPPNFYPHAAVGLPARHQRRETDAGGLQRALVAQGAFSAYWTEDLRAAGGWPDAIGEDIVLTWTMMDSRGIVSVRAAGARRHHRPRPAPPVHDAALPLGPRHVRGHQRQAAVATAASAGEGRCRHRLPGPVPGHRLRLLLDPRSDPVPVRLPTDLLVVVDAPGPDHAVLIFGLLRRWQERHVFRRFDVHPEPDRRGFFGYLLSTRR